MLLLALRRMSSSKWMIVCLLVGSIMASALVSCIPIYTDGILQRMLTRDMEKSQSETDRYPGAYSFNANVLGFKANERVSAYRFFDKSFNQGFNSDFKLPILETERDIFLDTMTLSTEDLRGKAKNLYVDCGSIDKVESHIKITNGRMYSDKAENGVYEVIVTNVAMQDFNLLLDKEYVLKCELSDYKGTEIKVKVVGVFTAKDETDVFWQNGVRVFDKSMLMNSKLFEKEFIAKNIGMIAKAHWYYALDYHKLKINNINSILNEFKSQTDWVKKYRSSIDMSFPITDTLKTYLSRSKQLKTTLWVLAVPVLLMLVFYIFMVSQLIVMHDENGIAVLKSRGAGKTQIFLSYLIESVIIGVFAFIAGPPLGMILCRILGASNGFLEFVERTTLPLNLQASVLIYSMLAVLLFIVTMLIPVILASRTTIVNYKQNKARANKSPLWQKTFLDVIILAASAYGMYRYNQQQEILSTTGMVATDLKIDPILFLSSTLFILGAGLLFLRIYPYIIRLIHWVGKRVWTPVMYASLIQVGRSRGREQFLMLFIILAISSGIFSANSARTINKNMEDRIQYMTGADVTIKAVWANNQPPVMAAMGAPESDEPKEPLRYYEPDYNKFSTLSGTEMATKVMTVDNATAQVFDKPYSNIKLMAVKPDEFAKIAWFRNDLLPTNIINYLNLMTDSPQALFLSVDLKERLNVKLGDSINVSWGENRDYIEGFVYAFINYWPTYNPKETTADGKQPSGLIVANYNYISNKLAIQPYEVWIKKKPDATDKQINDDIVKRKLDLEKISYKTQQIIVKKNDPMLQGTNGTLTLSFIAAMIISTLGFLIYWILSIQSRVLYFGILRAMGLSKTKIIGMIACEQVLVSGAAIIMGFVIGGLVGDFFIPMLQIVYSSVDQVPPFKIMEAAGDYIKVYTVVAIMLAIGFGTLWRIIAKIKIDQALKMGED